MSHYVEMALFVLIDISLYVEGGVSVGIGVVCLTV